MAPSRKPPNPKFQMDLDEAELRELEARRQVRKQQEIVLTASGVDADLARETLTIFEATLRACEENAALFKARVDAAAGRALQNPAAEDGVKSAVRKLFHRRG